MAGPSQAEVEIIIRYLQENKGELDKVQSGLEELATRMHAVIEAGNPKEIDRFIDSLNRLADEATKSGASLTALDHLMISAVRAMADGMEKEFPRVSQTISNGADQATEAIERTAEKMEDLRNATKDAINSEDLARIGALSKTMRDLSEATLSKGPPALADRVLLADIDRLTAGLERASASLHDVGADSNLRTVADEVEYVARQVEEMEKGASEVAPAFGGVTDETAALDKELVGLLSSLDKTYGAQVKLEQSTDLLNQGLEAGLITVKQHADALAQLRSNYAQTTQAQQQSNSLLEGTPQLIDGIKSAALQLGAALGIVASVRGIFDLFKLGYQDESLSIALEQVAVNAGHTREAIRGLREEVVQLGVTSSEANQGLIQMVNSGLSPEVMQRLSEGAKGLAKTFAKPVTDVFQQVTNAASRGSAMLLQRAYGIAINAQQVYVQEAERIGRPLTELEKKQAFAEALAARLKAATAGVGEGADMASTKVSKLTSVIDTLRDNLAAKLLPVYKEFLDLSIKVIEKINEQSEAEKENAEAARIAGENTSVLGRMLQGLGIIITGVIALIRENSEIALALAANFAIWGAMMLGPAGPIIALGLVVVGLVSFISTTDRGNAALALIVLAFEDFMYTCQEVYNTIERYLLVAAKNLWSVFGGGEEQVGKAVAALEKFDKKAKELADKRAINKAATAEARNVLQNGETPEAREARLAEALRAQKRKEEAQAARDKLSAAAGQRNRDEQAAAELRDHRNELAKLEAQGELDNLRIVANVRKAQSERLEAEDRARYDRGLLTLDQYYDARGKRLKQANEDELAIARKQAEVAERVAGLTRGGTPEAARAAQEAKLARKRVAETEEKITNELVRERITRANALLEIERRGTAMRLEAEIEADEQNLQAKIDQINQKYIKEAETLGGLHTAAMQRRQDQDIAKAQYEFLIEASRRLTEAMSTELDKQGALIDQRFGAGMMNETERMNAQNAIIQGRIELLKKQAQEQREIIALMGKTSTEGVRAAEEIKRIDVQIIQLGNSIQSYGKQIRENFTNELAKAIDGITENFRNAGEVLRNFALSVIKQIQGIVTRVAAQNITKAIIENTGGSASGGVFGAVGRMLGDGKPTGTKDNPIYTLPAGIEGAAANAIKSPLEMITGEGGLFETLRKKISEGFDWVSKLVGTGGVGITDLFKTLQGALTAIFESLSGAGGGGGGIGGFFSAISGFFSGGVTAAEGGKLVGPSHAEGGIHVNAEGGEYITRASQTSKWLGLLEAINTGMLDRVAGSIRPVRGRRFAEGGLVGSGAMAGSVVTNNVEINVDATGTRSAGDTEAASQLGSMIERALDEKLVHERLPGGLLYRG